MSTTSLVYNNYLGTWQYIINSRATTTSGALKIVANIAERNATTNRDNMAYWVLDATGDPSVASGSALYTFNSETQQWLKLAEQESMDISISFSWDQIENGPTANAAQIDGAVSVAHGHTNKSVLDTITVDNVHAHSNKTLLDSITLESGYLHTHSNLAALNTFTSTEIGRLRSITQEQVDGLHVHSNLTALNRFGVNEDTMITIDGDDLNDLLRVASSTENGVMTSADKIKLDSMTGDSTGLTEAERARLLPDDAIGGDMAICREGVDRGNNANTRLLVQPIDADGTVSDTAYGNAAPVALANSGVTVDENGDMIFDGSSFISIPAETLPITVLNTDTEWTLDIVFSVVQPDTWYALFGRNDSPGMQVILDRSGKMAMGVDLTLGTEWEFGVWQMLTFELYNDSGTWRWTAFRNGILVASGTWHTANWRAVPLGIGWDLSTGWGKFTGKMRSVRLTSGAVHRGVSFTPQNLPWLPPAKAWELISTADLKTELAVSTATRYVVAAFSGAVAIDYQNGDHQVCTTTDNVTGITINNLPINTGMVLDINNAAGKTVTFGSTELVATADIGRYPIPFYNDNGTIYAILNGAFVS